MMIADEVGWLLSLLVGILDGLARFKMIGRSNAPKKCRRRVRPNEWSKAVL
jgi:hypothetical protein